MSEPHEYQVVSRLEPFHGAIFSVVTDEVAMPGGGSARRDYTRNLGAAAIVALDDEDRVILVRQYRHAVREFLWELPAGLLDQPGEPSLRAAQRELAEEADLVAQDWELLLDLHPSPGFSDEVVYVYLARGLAEVPEGQRHDRDQEEAELTVRRVDLDEAVMMALCGEISSAAAVAGLLAAQAARDRQFVSVRGC